MTKVAYVIDATCFYTAEMRRHGDIYSLNFAVNYPDGTAYLADTDPEQTFRTWDKTDKEAIPKTSAPNQFECQLLIEYLLGKGYQAIFWIILSERASNMTAMVREVSRRYSDQVSMYYIDNGTASVGEELMLWRVIEMVDSGMDLDEVAGRLQNLVDRSVIYMILKEPSYWFQGGRGGLPDGLLDGRSHFTAVLKWYGKVGLPSALTRVRSYRQAFRAVRNDLLASARSFGQPLDIAVGYARRHDLSLRMADYLEETLPIARLLIRPQSGGVEAYMGPGSLLVGVLVNEADYLDYSCLGPEYDCAIYEGDVLPL